MSHKYLPITNKQQKHPKVFFEHYLASSGEPLEDNPIDLSPRLEAELLENSYFMKRRFRRIAQRLRNNYS